MQPLALAAVALAAIYMLLSFYAAPWGVMGLLGDHSTPYVTLAATFVVTCIIFLRTSKMAEEPTVEGPAEAKATPSPEKGESEKLTLVLDLDETLVHTFGYTDSMDKVEAAATLAQSDFFWHTFTLNGNKCTFAVLVRPRLQEFLEHVAKLFHVVIFTASKRVYADPLIDHIDKKGVVSARYFREHCVVDEDGLPRKDLRYVDGDLSRLLIVDNSPMTVIQRENCIPIANFTGDQKDEELVHMARVLQLVKDTTRNDVRKCILEIFLGGASDASADDKMLRCN